MTSAPPERPPTEQLLPGQPTLDRPTLDQLALDRPTADQPTADHLIATADQLTIGQLMTAIFRSPTARVPASPKVAL
ncbi:hypothetical protein [Kitasatospora sp. GAS204B]|uniref:hypothetical protein n=1 Tax=unclassified Kitasatospora TaxID=2633591 RepID=UPI0024741787|nr:hypothetical protein [Kitasatospora sp. GAS204B]MDH6122293.1 hypothetical protein [Kitasatospora sp. GAS204B]